MKTSDEFLEELKEFCSKQSMQAEYPLVERVVYACDVIELIEQFQAEQKQVSDEK